MRQAVWPYKLTIDRDNHAKADSYKRDTITAGEMNVAEDIRWNTDHSVAVSGVLLAGLVYALRRLDQEKLPEGWEQDLFEQISAHFDDTPTIPTRGDPDRAKALEKFGTSEAMREAHLVLEKAFALALRPNG